MNQLLSVCSLAMIVLGAGCARKNNESQNQAAQVGRAQTNQVIEKIVELVEKEGLEPKDANTYEKAKAHLLELVNSKVDVSQSTVKNKVNALLQTLDVDGHSMYWDKDEVARFSSMPMQGNEGLRSLGKVLSIAGNDVLVIEPPQVTETDISTIARYAIEADELIRAMVRGRKPCALVVNLSGQVGGNGWPPIAVLQSLFRPENSARMVRRDGTRASFYSLSGAESDLPIFRSLASSAIASLANEPFAVVTAKKTSSAGEMLAVLLKGEARARSFGYRTAGATTGNQTTTLGDGSVLLLSVARYAQGDGPPIRGGIAPDQPASEAFGSEEKVLLEAATWAVQQSKQCQNK